MNSLKTPKSNVSPNSTGFESWGLAGPTQAELEAIKKLAMSLNLKNQRQSADVLCQHFKTALAQPIGLPPHLASLALRELTKTNLWRHDPGPNPYRYVNAKLEPYLPNATWFDWTRNNASHAAVFLANRRGSSTKQLLAAGVHPASLYGQSWDGKDWPTPEECAQQLMLDSSMRSKDACMTIFNSLDAHSLDINRFRSAIADCARSALKNIWIDREGIANASEMSAVAQAAFFIERLSKKKSLPIDLAEVAEKIAAKRACFGELGDTPFEYSNEQKARFHPLVLLSANDDLHAFRTMAPLCGIESPEAIAAGAPAKVGHDRWDWQRGKYWTTRLVQQNAHLCAALMLERGDNPWLCAGDGYHGDRTQGNPFSWLASCASPSPNFGTFAIAWATAALRDAETRHPGNGLAKCIEAFETSRRDAPELWKAQGSLAALAACESVLIPSMMARDAQDGEPHSDPTPQAPARRSGSRL